MKFHKMGNACVYAPSSVSVGQTKLEGLEAVLESFVDGSLARDMAAYLLGALQSLGLESLGMQK